MVCRNLTGIYPCAVSGFIAVAVFFSRELLIAHHLLAFPDKHLRCHIPVGDGIGFTRIVVMVVLKAKVVYQLTHAAFRNRSHHQHLVYVFEWIWLIRTSIVAIRIVDCRV